MAHVVVSVEADQVRAQHTLEQLRPRRQHAENLARTEWRVQEKPHLQLLAAATQQRRQQEQMVIMHPHQVAILRHLQDRCGELPVHLLIGVPPIVGEFRPFDHVVQQRPQGGVGITFVKPVHLVTRQEHRHHAHPAQIRGDPPHVLEVLDRAARPAHPQLLQLGIHPGQRGSEPALGAARRAICLDPHRQAVGYHDQFAHGPTQHGMPRMSKDFFPEPRT